MSYAGEQVAPKHFEAYHQVILRPGALRAGIGYYASVWQDADDNAALKEAPLTMPVLALGGEASSGPALQMIWSTVTTDLKTHVVPKAGNWLGDENPDDVADALIAFFSG